MLLMPGKSNMDFMSIELKDGKVLFQYDLGSGVGSFETTETYNDGRWHTVFANRRNQNGLVKVDNATGESFECTKNLFARKLRTIKIPARRSSDVIIFGKKEKQK